jgi:hypothetical protein
MTPEETVVLARYVRAMYPHIKLDEFTPDAWHDVLARYDLNDARSAVVKHVRSGNAFISAGEITAEIRRVRNARIETADPYTGIGGTWPEEIAAIRQHNAALASGGQPERPALPASAAEPFDATKKGIAVLRAVGASTLSRRPELAATCPHCNAPAGRPCTTGKGQSRRDAHPTRIDASHALAAGEQPVDRRDAEQEIERRRAAAVAAAARLTALPEPDDDFDPIHRTKTAAKKTAAAETEAS